MLLEEAIEILSYEPEGTIESSRLKTALDFRVRLGNIVKDLEEYEKVIDKENQSFEKSENQESKTEKVNNKHQQIILTVMRNNTYTTLSNHLTISFYPCRMPQESIIHE